MPTTVQCAPDAAGACTTVSDSLSKAGVPVASQTFGTGSGTDSLNVLVGPWQELQHVLAADLIDHGPGSSGVYAKFAAGGSELQLLDPHGTVVRTLGPGTGLIAATADASSPPTWLVTGTDSSGVLAAAQALTAARLHDHFALAVAGGTYLPVPLEAGS